MEKAAYRSFRDEKEWENWLSKNHHETEGLWIRFYKKASGVQALNHDEALDVALCFGWIDAQSKPLDEESWIQKFTPRRQRSIWSKRNISHVERLTKEGRMRPPGQEAVRKAKEDGRWARAYDAPSQMEVPEDFLEALAKHKKALAFFETLNKTNRYAIAWRLQTAKKPETRQRRMEKLLDMLIRGEKLH
jgi:uncharacterized protein YdeI (YjbR/CyaY-like superfamily)